MKAMRKEELIKEAWGKLMPDYTNIDLDNGWSLNDFYEEGFNDFDFDTLQIYTPCKIRPKSLQGIENNNEWIKIESEDDLPNTHLDVLMFDSVNKVSIGFWDNLQMCFKNKFGQEYEFITHYQPIEKPKPPLY